MIEITVYRNQNNLYTGFDCIGHAGYANAGEDVFRLEKPSEHDSFLLIQSMTLGLQEIMNQYGNEFITLDFEEV